MNLKIKEVCKSKNISITELAQRMNIKQESLSRTINGNPTLSTLENIATALNVKITDLFEPNSNDFMAIVDTKGELRRFNNIEDLKNYIQSIDPIK